MRERDERVHLALRGEERSNNAAHKSHPPGGKVCTTPLGAGGRAGKGRRRGGLPGPPSCPPRRAPARQAGSKHLPAAPLLLPAGPGDDPAAAAAAATGEEVPPPGEPTWRPAPRPCPGGRAGPLRRPAGLRDLDVSPAGRAMVSAPQARVTTAGLAAPRPPRTHSPPQKTFNRGPPPEKVANPPRTRLKPRGPPARLAASGGDPGTVLPRPGGEGGRRQQAGREGAGSRLPVPLAPPPCMSPRRLSHRFVLPSSFSGGSGLPPMFLTQTCCRAAPGINATASFSPASNPSFPVLFLLLLANPHWIGSPHSHASFIHCK